MSFIHRLRRDAYRRSAIDSISTIVKQGVTSRTFRVIFTLRLCQVLNQSRWMRLLLLPFAKVLHHLASAIAAVDLPWRTEIGSGFAVMHGRGLVVSEGSRIGSNVTLFHGVTLGRRDRILQNNIREVGYPTLEDDVWVGPNAIVVGNVVVGKGSRIAGGAFVNFDVPPFCLVMGNPGKIVKEGCSSDVINRPKPDIKIL